GNVGLAVTQGPVPDADAANDTTASSATVTILDAAAKDFGAPANPIGTSVNGLSVTTAAGGGNQVITEASELTGMNLNAGAGNVSLVLTLGGVTGTTATDQITANVATVTLSDATPQN